MQAISQPCRRPAPARYPAAVAETVILSSARTPFGRLGGALASRTAVQLGVVAASAAFQRAGVEPGDIDYAVIGQVVQAGAGHIPSRQVTLATGVPEEIGSDTINKVCASGMRAVALADLMVRAGDRRLLLAGGMESMSNAPYLLMRARSGYRFGDGELLDANLSDGLRDPWSGKLMYEQASAVADELGTRARRARRVGAALAPAGDRRHRLGPHGRGDRGRRGARARRTRRSSTPTRRRGATRRSSGWPRCRRSTTRTRRTPPATRRASTTARPCSCVADADLARERALEPLARILATGCTANRHDSLARVPARGRADRARRAAGLAPATWT